MPRTPRSRSHSGGRGAEPTTDSTFRRGGTAGTLRGAMARTERRPRPGAAAADELAALLEAGDHRAAAARARELAARAGASDAERDAARAALARTSPERGALLAAAAGLALFLGVLLLGIVLRA
jgi:hypothetical protein